VSKQLTLEHGNGVDIPPPHRAQGHHITGDTGDTGSSAHG
jgi:hypothetical protein